MIIGDDVASGIHDEAGAKRLTHLVPRLGASAPWPLSKEPVEEILKILVGSRTLIRVAILVVVTARGNGGGCPMRTAAAGMCLLLGERLGIDVYHRRTHILGDLGKRRRKGNGVRNLQRRGVRAIRLRFIAMDPVDRNRTNQDAGGERAKDGKD